MSRSNISRSIGPIAEALTRFERMPKNCDISQIGPLHVVSLYDEYPSHALIRENVYCGMDANKDLAILKALVECAERFALEFSLTHDPQAALLPRSDGTAAFPTDNGLAYAGGQARANALAEAIERYVWASWWDNDQVGFEHFSVQAHQLSEMGAQLISSIQNLVGPGELTLIRPFFSAADRYSSFIFYLKLRTGGVLSGGAFGAPEDRESTQARALGELARHASAFVKSRDGYRGTTFYERRLEFMGTEQASQAFVNRLRRAGTQTLQLPQLVFDRTLSYPLSPEVEVHRCYFDGQPPFVGGDLERLCL